MMKGINAIFFAGLAMLLVTNSAAAQTREPLPLVSPDGTELELSRRVVSQPGAQLSDSPTPPTGDSDEILPFSVFYIYDETIEDGIKYFEVGPPGRPPSGWVSEQHAIEWPNNITLTFVPNGLRNPVLFFRSRPALSYALGEVVDHDWGGFRDLSEIAETVASADPESVEDESRALRWDGVDAIENPGLINWREQFYLMPVISFADVSPATADSDPLLLLETAVVPLRSDVSSKSCVPDQSTGVVFVVDSTKSMGPYIDRTLRTIERVSNKIRREARTDTISFGLVAYRDRLSDNPNTEYETKVYQTLDPNNDPTVFGAVLSRVTSTEESTSGFEENALAGIQDALDMDWGEFQNRWIILITDASTRETVEDRFGANVSLDGISKRLWDEAASGLIVFHLKTPEAKQADNVGEAEEQYTKLAAWYGYTSPYFGIENGDVDRFGDEIDSQIDLVIEQIGKSIETLEEEAAAGDKLAKIGLAQRVLWLGGCDAEVPAVLRGHILDHAVLKDESDSEGARKSVNMRILLTRIQLDNFRLSMQAVLDAAIAAPEEGDLLFEGAMANLARVSSDPSVSFGGTAGLRDTIEDEDFETISDFLPSYLALLPVKPDFMSMTRERWGNLSPAEINRLIKTLQRRVDNLEAIYNNPNVWFALHPDSDELDYVTPVLIGLFP